MKNKMKKLKMTLTMVAVTMIPVFIAGIVLIAYGVDYSRTILSDERNGHISDVAEALDHSISTIQDSYQKEMEFLLSGDAIAYAENVYKATKDASILNRMAESETPINMEYIEAIAVGDGNQLIAISGENELADFEMISTIDNPSFVIFRNPKTDLNFIAMKFSPEQNLLDYYLLFDFEKFYKTIIPAAIKEDYWVVLYESESGMIIQDDSTHSYFDFLTKEEIKRKSDDFSILLRAEEKNEKITGLFTDTLSTGEKKSIRLSVIPYHLSENKLFTIGLGMYDDNFNENNFKVFSMFFIAALLIASSIGFVVFFAIHSGKREEELAAEVLGVEKEKQLLQEMLDIQEAMFHRQRLEVVGTMTAGISHEFNNLLAPILGNSLMILEKTPEDSEDYDSVLAIYDAADKAKKLVARISGLTRKSSKSQMRVIHAEELFTNALAVSQSSIPKNISVEKSIDTDEGFLGEESQLNHLMINLIINSVQAMGKKNGVLTLKARDDGNNIIITVSDTGPGFPEDVIDHIFEPFFTTKDVGKGTGLGLALAQRIVTNHNGTIEASNLPEGGACMTITIPVFRQ